MQNPSAPIIYREIKETPDSLVENGKIHSGFYKTPFRKVNLLDANNFGGTLARPLRLLRLKEWVGYGISHSSLFGGILIQNAKYAASGTVYLFDRDSNRLYDWTIVDLPLRTRLPETLWHSQTICGYGKKRICFSHDLDHFEHRIRAEIAGLKKLPPVSVDLVLHQNWLKTDPLVVSLPIPPDHHTYTHKSPLHLEGIIKIDSKVFEFDPARDIGNLDEQKTFYPYHSHWLWGSITGFTREGREIMANFVNQMTPHDEPGEDALWIDGKLMLMEQPSFIHNKEDGTYRIEDKSGRVKLFFTPIGAKKELRNFMLISMDYAQNCGTYDGEIIDETGTLHHIDGLFGPLERMEARF